MFELFKLFLEPYEDRETAPKVHPENNNGVGVSTVYASDVNQYETALLDATGAHPVERYHSKESAEIGHRKWIELARSESLQIITVLGNKFYGTESRVVRVRRVSNEPNH